MGSDRADGIDWPAAVKELKRYGVKAKVEQIQDIEWVFAELARRGYSLRITMETPASYVAKVKQIGKLSENDPFVVQNRDALARMPSGGAFTYQLQGPRYAERGSHNSFMHVTVIQAALVALSNIVRLDWEERKRGDAT